MCAFRMTFQWPKDCYSITIWTFCVVLKLAKTQVTSRNVFHVHHNYTSLNLELQRKWTGNYGLIWLRWICLFYSSRMKRMGLNFLTQSHITISQTYIFKRIHTQLIYVLILASRLLSRSQFESRHHQICVTTNHINRHHPGTTPNYIDLYQFTDNSTAQQTDCASMIIFINSVCWRCRLICESRIGINCRCWQPRSTQLWFDCETITLVYGVISIT